MKDVNTEKFEQEKIIPDIEKNIRRIEQICDKSSDMLINRITVSGVKVALLACEGMISTSNSTELILRPLSELSVEDCDGEKLLTYIDSNRLFSLDRPKVDNYGELFRTVNSGFAVLIADGAGRALAFGVQGYSVKSIGEPSGERNITGSHEGFCEVIRTNMSLVRRRMKTPLLKFELFPMGTKSKTDLCLCYMRDRVPEKLIERIKKSLDETDLETIISTGYIKPFLEEKKKRILDSVGTTERPDVLCSKLLEGRVALFIDGTPFALVIPKLFVENFQTLDDYNCKPYYAFFIRWLKYLAFTVSVLLPAVYVAIAVHHPEMLNTTLLMILADAENTAPFSLLAEALSVLLMYEIIREAGIRLPENVGGAVGIVGGIIIGDSAVSSGLISTPLLTVVALSVTSGFLISELNQSITVLRIAFLIMGGLWGLFGISLLGIAVIFNIVSTEDYSFPITVPLSPFTSSAMRDVLVRTGFRKMQKGNFTIEKLKK